MILLSDENAKGEFGLLGDRWDRLSLLVDGVVIWTHVAKLETFLAIFGDGMGKHLHSKFENDCRRDFCRFWRHLDSENRKLLIRCMFDPKYKPSREEGEVVEECSVAERDNLIHQPSYREGPIALCENKRAWKLSANENNVECPECLILMRKKKINMDRQDQSDASAAESGVRDGE